MLGWKSDDYPPCLTLSIIRYESRVKCCNPRKGVRPSPKLWYSRCRKGSRQLYLYIYIYICVCVCVFTQPLRHGLDATQDHFLNAVTDSLNSEFPFSLIGCNAMPKLTVLVYVNVFRKQICFKVCIVSGQEEVCMILF